MLAAERDPAEERELETVFCAHCSWRAVRPRPRQVADPAWPMRMVDEHVRAQHPERLRRLAHLAGGT